jgi:hypothetical protein
MNQSADRQSVLGSAGGVFISVSTAAAYSWRLLHSKYLRIPHLKAAGSRPLLANVQGEVHPPPPVTEEGRALTALCRQPG